ncbi:hypothetical protein [Nodosilinea nodulosa]|uniref:hypothetical protein n=1 Tax=Nodosilinea nodulosa TaxID=416001 RepID=UPI00037D00B7|nr:hypothetical protein [Nodosilinea nodulosa]
MEIRLSQSASKLLDLLKTALQADESAVIEEAIHELHVRLVSEGVISKDNSPKPLAEVLDRADLLKGLYLCTRNALGVNHPKNTPLILEANTEEEAWQKMALLFPPETAQGFTIRGIEPLNL